MDTKRMITGMLLAMAVVLGYKMFIGWLWTKNNWKLPETDSPSSLIAQDTPSSATSPSTNPTTSSAAIAAAGATTLPSSQPGGMSIVGADVEQPAIIGSAADHDPNYVMGVRLRAQGAGIESVALNQFKLDIGKLEPYTFDQAADAGPEDRAMASRSISINGKSIDLAHVNWKLDSTSPGEAIYVVEIQSNGENLARVRKIYHLDTRPESKGKSEGYELTVTLAVENLGASPLKMNTAFNGPLPPRPETTRGPDRNIIGGYDNGGAIELNHHPIEELKADKPTHDLTHSEKNNHALVWAGIGGTYFDSILRPLPQGKDAGAASYIQSVQAQSIHPEIQREHPQAGLTFTTTEQTIEPRATVSMSMKLFCGPKQRSLLENAYYSVPLISYRDTLVMTSGICGFCAIDWLISALVWMMSMFHAIFRDWGLAIIGLVCIVRLILHPITKKSQVNMMKMTKMGPEMERLKKKFGDDKDAITKAQMSMYKEMGFTPVLGCLPMFLQMPIFISLWQALQSTFELRHAPFLWNLTWIKDLSQPDRLISFGHAVPLIFGWHIDAINVLPILVAIVSFINMKYTPRPPAATPEAEQQQKMMQWMTLIFPLMFYSFPSGLNIYYLTSTSLGIVEGKRIRAHIKQHEEAEKAGLVVVDDPSPVRRVRSGKTEAPPEPKTGLAGWLMRLQERAEQMRTEPDKKNKRR